LFHFHKSIVREDLVLCGTVDILAASISRPSHQTGC
jgi:hypothetical protein